ncbi:inositol polyphosphate-5-phosphatase A isoform X1 [Cherax quadricarinatus]
MANTSSTRMLLVTANIASCFEQPDSMLKPWITEFLKTVEEHEPHFIALHCQEVGGKNYEESMQHVEHFVRSLMNRGTMLPYDKIRVYLDEEYDSAEKFTALGNLYFIHQNVQDLQIWDFKEKKFMDCVDRREYSGNIEDVATKEKAKFPQEFFPECKWSRKGFMRTRWCLNGTKFDLVNIHLFHDASNFIAMEEFPSVYSLNRKRALEHTLDRFHNDGFENVPIFLFGDFNFRMNTHAVVQKLTQDCTAVEAELPDTGEKAQEFRDNEGKVLLTISKKAFRHYEHQTIFVKDNGSWLHEFDQELAQFGDRLTEFPITFPPSYPFEEGADGDGSHYMQTRCPSWCDRIILNKAAKTLIDASGGKVTYNLIGQSTTMGDHKVIIFF